MPANRLLASLGPGRPGAAARARAANGSRADHHHAIADEAQARCSSGFRPRSATDTAPPGPPLPAQKDARALLRGDDDSLQIHACHGRARQVEVIRDAILHLLERDPTLEPRDVIVMCPDIETFAPLIQATFGAGRALDDGADDDDASVAAAERRRLPDLRVRLADRIAAPDESRPRRRLAAARARRRSDHRLPVARPRRPRARPPALPLRR